MMNPSELLLTALDQRYDKYLKEVARAKAEFSVEAVHDLRVATRRLLALIDLLRTLAPRPRLQNLRKDLKVQLDELDELRDTQVMLAETTGRLEALPTLQPFHKYLQKRERRFLKAAARDVRNFNLREVARRLEKTRSVVADPEFSQALTARVLGVLDEVFEMVIQRKGRVDPAAPASIHRVRVAFKKFRYMVEIIHPCLPAYPKTYLKRMQAYQTLMGEIQDVEVYLSMLKRFAAKHESSDLQPAIRFYEQRHAEVVTAYLENMNELAVFWRANSKTSFPWKARKEKV